MSKLHELLREAIEPSPYTINQWAEIVEELENWGEEGWAWVEAVCKMLDCGEGEEYEIREKIDALKLRPPTQDDE